MRGILNFNPYPTDQFSNGDLPEVDDLADFSSHYDALPYDASPAHLQGQDISRVDPLAGINSPGQPVIPTQDIWNDLNTLRLKMPWLPITMFPHSIRSAFMALANTPTDIHVPTSAAIAQFYGTGDFYVSLGGRAVIPTAATDVEASTLYKPQGFFYIGNAKQISVVSPNANGIVQIAFWNK